MVYPLPNGLVVELVQGDITDQEVDTIANAVNSYLQHGTGVAGAIVRKGGHKIQRENDDWMRKHGPVSAGGVTVTEAGRLKAKYVIHAVGLR